MNIFRFFGDLSHLASIFILLHKIQTTRSCRGISFKTQVLYLVVFLTRYVDLVTEDRVSVYNTLMKLFFIGSTGYTLYLMRLRFRCVFGKHLQVKADFYPSLSAPLQFVADPFRLDSWSNPNCLWTHRPLSISLRPHSNSQTHTRRITGYFPPDLPPSTRRHPFPDLQLRLHPRRDHLGLLNLARIRRHPPPIIHAPTNRRSRDNHHTLPSCARSISGVIYSQLDVPVRLFPLSRTISKYVELEDLIVTSDTLQKAPLIRSQSSRA